MLHFSLNDDDDIEINSNKKNEEEKASKLAKNHPESETETTHFNRGVEKSVDLL